MRGENRSAVVWIGGSVRSWGPPCRVPFTDQEVGAPALAFQFTPCRTPLGWVGGDWGEPVPTQLCPGGDPPLRAQPHLRDGPAHIGNGVPRTRVPGLGPDTRWRLQDTECRRLPGSRSPSIAHLQLGHDLIRSPLCRRGRRHRRCLALDPELRDNQPVLGTGGLGPRR